MIAIKHEKHVYWHMGNSFFSVSLCCKMGVFMWVALLLGFVCFLFFLKLFCCEDNFDAQGSVFGKLCSR